MGLVPNARAAHANQRVRVAIPTGIGVVRTGAAVIVIDRGFGTLTEIGYALAEVASWPSQANGPTA